MKEKNGVVITGCSGAGKSTIVKYLLEKYPILEFSVSATTRHPRPNEIHGKDYYFVSKQTFMEWLQKDMFLEVEEVYPGIFYGTLYSEIERIKTLGKIPLFDVDIFGAINIKNKFNESVITIFIEPPSFEKLKKRLLERGTEDPQSLQKRLIKAQKELLLKDKCDFCVINDDLLKALNNISQIIENFLNKE